MSNTAIASIYSPSKTESTQTAQKFKETVTFLKNTYCNVDGEKDFPVFTGALILVEETGIKFYVNDQDPTPDYRQGDHEKIKKQHNIPADKPAPQCFLWLNRNGDTYLIVTQDISESYITMAVEMFKLNMENALEEYGIEMLLLANINPNDKNHVLNIINPEDGSVFASKKDFNKNVSSKALWENARQQVKTITKTIRKGLLPADARYPDYSEY